VKNGDENSRGKKVRAGEETVWRGRSGGRERQMSSEAGEQNGRKEKGDADDPSHKKSAVSVEVQRQGM
jgi:hypothetical protein